MKILLLTCLVILTGCRSAIPVAVAPPAPPRATVEPSPAVDAGIERRLRRQSQLVEVLMSQNEALRAQLQHQAEPTPAAPAVTAPPVAERDRVTDEAVGSVLTPNADGVIDLTATPAAAAEANPFAVRKLPDGAAREVALHLAGIISGTKPCAVINERLVETGDTVEGFTVGRIDASAVILEIQGQRLRLPLTEKPVRVRVAS